MYGGQIKFVQFYFVSQRVHYATLQWRQTGDMTSQITGTLTVWPTLIPANNKENIKTVHYWASVRGAYRWLVYFSTQGQECGKPFRVVTPSWKYLSAVKNGAMVIFLRFDVSVFRISSRYWYDACVDIHSTIKNVDCQSRTHKQYHTCWWLDDLRS